MSRGQSHSHSVIESLVNVVVGFGIATGANWIIMPWFGHQVSVTDSAGIGGVLTVISILRSYLLRRAFNSWHMRG